MSFPVIWQLSVAALIKNYDYFLILFGEIIVDTPHSWPLCFSARTGKKGGACIQVNVKGPGTCYSATYMSQTRDQQRFTISEVAADWHEPMVPQHIMWPSIARANRQLGAHEDK